MMERGMVMSTQVAAMPDKNHNSSLTSRSVLKLELGDKALLP